MYQGGPSRKQRPRLTMHDADDEPPRDAPVRACEWPSEDFMDQEGIKEEFNAYLRNADLVSFEAEKCPQYHYLTSSFVRRFEFSSSRNSQTVLFDLYENSYLRLQKILQRKKVHLLNSKKHYDQKVNYQFLKQTKLL